MTTPYQPHCSQTGQETHRKNYNLYLEGIFFVASMLFEEFPKGVKRLKSARYCDTLLDMGWQRLKTWAF